MIVLIWVEIKNFPNYELSNTGLVRNKKFGRFCKPYLDGRGYVNYALCLNGKKFNKMLHRLLAEHFIPKVNGKDYVNHIDANQQNNCISNLEWCTSSENCLHAIALGLWPKKRNRSGKTTNTH